VKQSVPDAAFVPDYLPLPPRIDPVPPRPEADVPPAAAADVVAPASRKEAFLRLLRRPMFLVAVLIPNLLSILYFGLIASPVYVSTASLVVRNPQKSEPSLPTLLAGADGSEKGGYLLKSYFSSWQAFTRVEKPMALARNFAAGDFVSRYAASPGCSGPMMSRCGSISTRMSTSISTKKAASCRCASKVTGRTSRTVWPARC